MSSRRPITPPSARHTNTHSRTPSVISQNPQHHAPQVPSSLREAHTFGASPEISGDGSGGDTAPSSSNPSPNTYPTHLDTDPAADDDATDGETHGAGISGFGNRVASETTALLRRPFELVTTAAHSGPCDHGTFSPRLESRAHSIRSGHSGYGFGGSPPRTAREAGGSSASMFGSFLENVGMKNGSGAPSKKKMSTTSYLAEQHGIKNTTTMYVLRFGSFGAGCFANLCRYFTYYIPFFAWIRQYRWVHLQGDLIAALTMASFYLPMALSYASNLAHVPPINGLYSFVFNPLIYAILGSCPQMVVGPEAAGSLLVGSVVRSSVDSGTTPELDDIMHARVAGVVTGMAGAVIFIAGLTRLGFLDSVLSKPFLRGFISAIGFVIMVDQLVPELGLAALADKAKVSHGSSVNKLRFLFGNVQYASGNTAAVAGVSFVIIMTFR